eukprot:6142215-Prymnesium_polylepis.1
MAWLRHLPCLTRGRVGALRGRHTTTTYSPLIDTYLVPEAPQGRVALDTAPGRHHRPSATRLFHNAYTYLVRV